MSPDYFVSGLVEAVHESAVTGTMARLEAPGGRRPQASVVELSKWYGMLSESDRGRLRQVVEHAVHATLFGTLCVLDGVRTVEPAGSKTDFQLLAVRQGEVTMLNDPNGEALHDRYQGEVYERVFGVQP